MTNLKGKRILLIPPDKSLLNLFKGIYNKKTFFEKALTWLGVIFIRIPAGLVIFILTVAVRLIIQLFKGGKIAKRKAQQLSTSLMSIFPEIVIGKNQIKITEDTLLFFNSCKDMQVHTILYIHISQEALLKKCNVLKQKGFVNEIWFYENEYELLEKAKSVKCNLENSFIVGYNVIHEKLKWDTSFHEKENNLIYLNRLSDIVDSKWNENRRKTSFLSFKDIVETNTFNRVYLQPNTFLTYPEVLFVESAAYPELNRYVEENYNSIQLAFREKGFSFIYLNNVSPERDINFLSRIINFLQYKMPSLFEGIEESPESIISQLFTDSTYKGFAGLLKTVLHIPDFDSPVLLHCIERDVEKSFTDGYLTYSVYFLKPTETLTAAGLFQFYFSKLGRQTNDIYLQIGNREETEYDADANFSFEANAISPEVKAAVDSLTAMNNEKLVLASLKFIIESLKDASPEVFKKINRQFLHNLSFDAPAKTSRLIIDAQYRIWLPDYQNIEIVMTPLPKSFFIFMLRHPEGLLFKELNQHKDELISIYSKVGNRLEMDQIKSSINDLVNVRSNSVNEKCSRIKEAFISKIDDSLAKNYYVNGGRQNVKQITLDRSLLDFNQTF